MTPYYEQDGITIYHGDCREVGWSATVLITDPPYGIEFKGKGTRWTKPSGGYTNPDCSEVGPEAVISALSIVQRGVVFCGPSSLWKYPEPSALGCVYCPSGAGRNSWGFQCFHPILFYGKRPGYPGATSFQSFETAGESDHPCPKPLGWMEWCIRRSTIDCDVVVDLFAGSGTTLIAAKNCGRRAIGIEIEERYCEIAAKRLGQSVLSFKD